MKPIPVILARNLRRLVADVGWWLYCRYTSRRAVARRCRRVLNRVTL